MHASNAEHVINNNLVNDDRGYDNDLARVQELLNMSKSSTMYETM